MQVKEHSAILSTFIKLPFSIKTFVLSVFKWPLKTGFTVYPNVCYNKVCYKGTALYLVWTRLLLKKLPDLELHSVCLLFLSGILENQILVRFDQVIFCMKFYVSKFLCVPLSNPVMIIE